MRCHTANTRLAAERILATVNEHYHFLMFFFKEKICPLELWCPGRRQPASAQLSLGWPFGLSTLFSSSFNGLHPYFACMCISWNCTVCGHVLRSMSSFKVKCQYTYRSNHWFLHRTLTFRPVEKDFVFGIVVLYFGIS